MASGAWNHTAATVAAQINLSRVVGHLFVKGTISFVSEKDVHPYRRKPRADELKKEFVARWQEISNKLPREERKAARDKLIKEYREQASK